MDALDLLKFYGLEVDARRWLYLADGRTLKGTVFGVATADMRGAFSVLAVQFRTDDGPIVAVPITGITSIEAAKA